MLSVQWRSEVTKMTQVEYSIQELRENARMKRRQAEILGAEANALDASADKIERAIDIDKKRVADSAGEKP